MKFLFAYLLTALSMSVFSQHMDSLGVQSNSFENHYRKLYPTLIYSYNSASQTHNYSNNWDFDNDGINDEVYFVGLGGVHLYYSLKLVLSTDHKPIEFNFIQSDFPFLTAIDTLGFDKTQVGFVVTDFDKNSTPAIIVRLDEQTFCGNKELEKRNIRTKNIIIRFQNGKPKCGNL